MSTTFALEPGYSSLHRTKVDEILSLLREIEVEELSDRCERLGIRKFCPEECTFREYYIHFLKEDDGFHVRNEYISFYCAGGGEHRHVAEFVVKTICLMVIERGLILDYNIDLVST